eukprot:12193002-Karenia_brevis.AAC.1
MDSLEIPGTSGEEKSPEDDRSENNVIVADSGVLDACGMVYKPMGQRNANPTDGKVVCGSELLEQPAMQGVGDSVVGLLRGSVCPGDLDP